jgi:hypothetical protein
MSRVDVDEAGDVEVAVRGLRRDERPGPGPEGGGTPAAAPAAGTPTMEPEERELEAGAH